MQACMHVDIQKPEGDPSMYNTDRVPKDAARLTYMYNNYSLEVYINSHSPQCDWY